MALDAKTRKDAGGGFVHQMVGKVVNERYRVTRLVGQGGMGAVYEARDLHQGGAVYALKMIKLGLFNDRETVRRRALREAQIGMNIKHRGIVPVLDVQEWTANPETLFSVMPLLDGETLHNRIHASRGGLPWMDAVRIVRQVAEAVSAAHAADVIHRDLKPANIFLCSDGLVVVLDFGIAFLLWEKLTRTGTYMGTPGYAAPEQLQEGRKIDARTDVWSLGAVLYAALTGDAPIKATVYPEAVAELKRGEIASVGKRNPSVPAAVVALTDKMLALDPAARYQTMADVIAACDAILATDPLIGCRVWGNYVVERKIGAGGMGSVYCITQPNLGRRYALKLLAGDYDGTGGDERREARFQQEAKAAAAVPDHHVVKAVDHGRLPDGRSFLIFDYVDGPDLADELKRTGPFAVERAVKLVARIAHALACAHEQGIIHRDLKPQNILLERQGQKEVPKLCDFGIARMSRTQKMVETGEQAVMGTPGYISPEAVLGGSATLDGRADVFSLGVVLYELLTGELPWPANNPTQAMSAPFLRPAPLVSVRRPAGLDPVSPPLDAIVARALAVDPPKRFTTMTEFEAALLDAGARRSAEGAVVAPMATMLSIVPVALTPANHPTLSPDSGKVSDLVARLSVGSVDGASRDPAAALLARQSSDGNAPAPARSRTLLIVAVFAAAAAIVTVALLLGWVWYRPNAPIREAAPQPVQPAAAPLPSPPAAPLPEAPAPTPAPVAAPAAPPAKHHHHAPPTHVAPPKDAAQNKGEQPKPKLAPGLIGID